MLGETTHRVEKAQKGLLMQLNEETGSAISEIGNLCIAGGSNKISTYSEETVDISVVEAEVKDTEHLMLEVDIHDDFKKFVGLGVDGDVSGFLLVRISDDLVESTTTKFPKLKALQEGKDSYEAFTELANYFLEGFAEGMAGMTGLGINSNGPGGYVTELDPAQFPKKVLCYSSVISVGDERIDFDVFFFSDAETLIPKVLESLGL